MTPTARNDYTLDISDCLDVRAQLRQLGCHEPDGFAFLPFNFESAHDIEELRRNLEAVTLKKLLIAADLPYGDIVSRDSRIPIAQTYAIELVLPTLLVTAPLVSANPSLVNIALGVISNYVTDYFRGMSRGQRVKMDMVYESPTGSYKRVTYEGPPECIEQSVRAFDEVRHG